MGCKNPQPMPEHLKNKPPAPSPPPPPKKLVLKVKKIYGYIKCPPGLFAEIYP